MTRSSLDGGDGDGHRVLGPSLINCRQNATFGRYVHHMRELRMTDSSFFIYMRMELNMFDKIFNRVGL